VPEAGNPSEQGWVDKRTGSSPIRVVVGLLAAVAAVFLVAIGALARAAATGAESYFNFFAWLIPSMGVVLSLVLALVGAVVVRHMMKGQASSARPEATVEAAKETAPVVGQDPADLSEQRSGRPYATNIDRLRREKPLSWRHRPLHPLSEVDLAFAKALELPSDKVAVEDDDEVLVVRAELPGVPPGDVDITFQGNVLTISKLIRNKSWHHEGYELRTGEDVLLPQQPVDKDDVSDRFEGGVLKVTIKGAAPRAPILGYDEMSAAEVAEQLNDLSAEDLLLLRDYEKRNKNRPYLLEQMDSKINAL
jgi:HSP20 family molecular chaperone IbpA